MWIRTVLIVLPIVLIAGMLASVAFVPSTSSAGSSEYRQERLIDYLTGDSESLNPWLATATTDSDIYTYLFDSVMSYNDDFQLEPKLAEGVRVGEEVIVLMDPGMDAAVLKATIDEQLKKAYPGQYVGTQEYDRRKFDSEKYFRNSADRLKLPVEAAADGAARFVLEFRPDPSKSYGPKDMPSSVVPAISEDIDRIMAAAFERPAFVKSYDQTRVAGLWYAHRYSIENPLYDPGVAPELKQGASDTERKEHDKALKSYREELKIKRATYGKALSEAAKKKDESAQTFDLYVKAFPPARIGEHMIVSVKLREGVKWHDYDETKEILDSDDVVFTYAFGRDPDVNSPRKSAALSITQFRVHDKYRFDVVFKDLYSPGLSNLAMSLLPAHKFTDAEWARQAKARGQGPAFDGDPTYNPRKALHAKQLEFSKFPVGTGPMKIIPLNGEASPAWRPGELVRLGRFDGHWNPIERPLFKYVDFYIFDPDLGAETTEIVFRTGGLDIYTVPAHQIEEYRKLRDRYYVYERLTTTYEYFAFNLERELFKDKRVRQAMAMAVNVEDIIKYVAKGQGVRITGPAYPVLAWYDWDYIPDYTFRQGEHKNRTLREAGLKYFPYDITEAQALLTEAGWTKNSDGKLVNKDGALFKFKLCLSGISGARGKFCILAREQWVKLGMDVELEDLEWNVFLNERTRARSFDVMVLGWSGGVDFDKRQLWHSKFLAPNDGLNFTGYSNPVVDGLLEDITREYEYEKQKEMSHQIFRLIADDLPYIFLFSTIETIAIDRGLVWSRPVIASDGSVAGREQLSILDPEAMITKTGPAGSRKFRMQWVRSGADTHAFHYAPEHDREIGRVGSEEARAAYMAAYPARR